MITKAVWIPCDQGEIKKGKWHNWIQEAYNFFKRIAYNRHLGTQTAFSIKSLSLNPIQQTSKLTSRMSEKSKYLLSIFFKISLPVTIALLSVGNAFTQIDPSTSFGNTFIHTEGNLTVFGSHSFDNSNTGSQPGIIGGERVPAIGYFNFAPGATWVDADNARYVDGYVRHFGNTKFLFPIGDDGMYRPLAVSGGSYVEAAYFRSDPTIAVTSDIRGGDFPVLPQSGPFDISLFDDAVIRVSEYEYWDLNGSDPTIITLTWDENSFVDIITSNDIERLAIVGWNGAQWEYIPSYIDLTSISFTDYNAQFNGPAPNYLSGSISTKVPVVPSSYEVYTLASSCLYMELDVSNEMQICLGDEFTLTASSYEEAEIVWNTGDVGPTITDMPTENTLYSVTATLGSCEVTREIFVEVRDLNVDLGVDTFVCSGNDINIEAIANYPGTYQWEHRGVLTFGGDNITLENLNTPSTLYVTVTDDNGCTAIDDVFINIRQSPDVFTGRDASVCLGDSTFIQAFGSESGYGYQWSTGDTASLIWVQPLQNTTYEVSLTENGCEDVSFVSVEVFPQAYIEILNDNIICSGDEITLEVEATTGTVEWNTGATTESLTINPIAGETYSVTLTSPGNCQWIDEITFESYESTIEYTEEVYICEGESVDLSVDGIFDSVLWTTNETTTDITVSPSSTTVYQVDCIYGSCTVTKEITVIVDNVLEVNLGPDVEICQGESVTLGSNSGGQHIWNTSQTSSTITVSPFSTQTYSVTVTSGGCVDTDEIVVNVNENPAYVEITTDSLFCPGQEVLLQASGSQGNYLWSNDNTNPSFTVTPNNNQSYSVTVTNASGCQYSDQITFTSYQNSSVDIGPDQTICKGETIQLEVEGNYTSLYWSNGSNNDFISVSPLATTEYYVTATLNGCESYDTVTVNVVNIVDLSLGSDITICNGETVDLEITQYTGNFQWSTGQTGNAITLNPTSTGTYSVTLTSGSCQAIDEITIFVDDPQIEISGNNFYCPGESLTLTAEATEGNIIWNTGAFGESITVFPTGNQEFSATVISPDGCTAVDNFYASPIDLSSVSLGPDISICEGGNVNLSIQGNYDLISWSNGSIGNNISVSPLNSTSYSVTVTEGNCSISDTVEVLVTEDFTLNLGPDLTICPGESTILTSPMQGQYLWSTGSTNNQISVSPLNTSTYSLTVTSGQCEASDIIQVIVADEAYVEIDGESSICPGMQTTLNAIGPPGNYIWNTGHTSPSITVTPNPGQTFSVTVTTNDGCIASDQITISSFNAQSIDLGEDIQICTGETVDLELEGNFDQIEWSTGQTGSSISVSPSTTTTITVSAWKGTCMVSDNITIEILEQLNLDLGPNQTICNGQTVILSSSIAGSYQWSTGENSDIISVSPERTTVYTATVTSGQCQSTDQITIFVENQAYVDIQTQNYFCPGEQINLITNGSQGSYTWSNGMFGQSITINPIEYNWYHVTVTTPDGCIATDSIQMIPFQDINFINQDNISICNGETVKLEINEPYTSLTWEDGSTDNPRFVSPSQNTVYSATIDLRNCSTTEFVNVIIDNTIELDLGQDIIICEGEMAEIGTDLTGQYQWSTGETTPYIFVSPDNSETYSLTITSGECIFMDSIIVSKEDAFIEILNSSVFCEEELTTIETNSSGGTYLWSTGATTPSIDVIPLANSTYSVTVTSPDGCVAEDQITFSKYNNRNISLGPDKTICIGGSIQLEVRGIFDYVIWSDGFIGPVRTVTPGNTTTYTVTGVYGSCLSFDQITVYVEENLELNLGADIVICPGQSVELGDLQTGGNYEWSTGETTPTIFVTPQSTTSYTVTVTSGVCVSQEEITVFVSNDCLVDVYVNKSVDNFNPTAGDTIEFSVLIGNEGSISATNIQLEDFIESGFKYISHNTTKGFYNPNSSVWYINKLDSDDSALLFIQAEVLPIGDYFNIAQLIKADQVDEDSEPANDDNTEDDYAIVVLDVEINEEVPDNTSEIGDYVWHDKNGDGFQDLSEQGLENIEVQLYSSDDFNIPYASTITTDEGYFCFTNLSSGAYFVKFIVPDSMIITKPKRAGTNTSLDNKDSDIENTFGYGTTNMISLGIDQQIKTCDGGLYKGGSIGDLVWRDGISGIDDKYDGDLIDVGVEGIMLRLYDFNADTMMLETVTDDNGLYRFENLAQGDYYLHLVDNGGEKIRPVQPNKFAPDIDSDFDQVSLKTARISLGPEEHVDTVDAGLSISLPLTLVDFWGERIYDQRLNRLFWTTESEFNTDKFIVERRLASQTQFEDIGEIKAAGNSSETLFYTFDDNNSAPAGEYFYRLRMIDLDGRFEYSNIIVIKVYEDGELENQDIYYKVYPIPTTDYLKLEIGTKNLYEFHGMLVNNLGQHVRTFSKRQLSIGVNIVDMEVLDLPQGQYYLNFYIGEEQYITKVLILD